MFYSKLLQVADQKIRGSVSEDQLLATLKNAGVTDEEIRDMGVKSLFGASKSIDRDTLLEKLGDATIPIDEEWMPRAEAAKLEWEGGAKHDPYVEGMMTFPDPKNLEVGDSLHAGDGPYYRIENIGDSFRLFEEGDLLGVFKTLEEAQQAAQKEYSGVWPQGFHKPTEYESHSTCVKKPVREQSDCTGR